ncbi:MAG: hypothetical protein FJ267_17580 [Planctomycetes bacterium]|nr:hypothetical protein [Planctomycetota bacterium]
MTSSLIAKLVINHIKNAMRQRADDIQLRGAAGSLPLVSFYIDEAQHVLDTQSRANGSSSSRAQASGPTRITAVRNTTAPVIHAPALEKNNSTSKSWHSSTEFGFRTMRLGTGSEQCSHHKPATSSTNRGRNGMSFSVN